MNTSFLGLFSKFLVDLFHWLLKINRAFVCVQAKKQAMILAPSTVLSDQHHESFTKRFSNFPMNISILTRHTSPKARAKLYEDFKNKKIDILVGTHALLNNDIDLSSLGLSGNLCNTHFNIPRNCITVLVSKGSFRKAYDISLISCYRNDFV